MKLRRAIKAATVESPNRDYSWGLLDFLIGQGVSKDEILTNLMRYFDADDVVACLESIARDFDIPLEDSIESCDIVASEDDTITLRRSNSETARLVNEWYDSESYPDADPQRLAALRGIDWDINAEDVEFFLYNTETFPDLSALKHVSYFEYEPMQDWIEKEGYDGGYIVIYNNGAERDFAWYAGKPELYDVTEDATYMWGNQKYRDSVKNEPFAHAMSRYNERIAEETYGNKWNVDHDIYSSSDVTCSTDLVSELESLLQAEGNGAGCIGQKTGNTYYLWVQETGPGYAIYFDDGNIWRDRSQDKEPLLFSSLDEVAEWLMNN